MGEGGGGIFTKQTSVQLGKDFGLDFALERGQILICGEVKLTHSLWPRV